MRFGRQAVVSEPRLYNPGEAFDTPAFGNNEAFQVPSHDEVWTDPRSGEQPESRPGVFRLRPRGFQWRVDLSQLSNPQKVKDPHTASDVLEFLIGRDGTSGKIGGEPRYVRELTPSDAIDDAEDARIIAAARDLYLKGAVRVAQTAIDRHYQRNEELKAKGLRPMPPSDLVKRHMATIAGAGKVVGVSCPRCYDEVADLGKLKDHIDTLHPDEKETLYTESGIKAAKRKYTRKAKEAAA